MDFEKFRTKYDNFNNSINNLLRPFVSIYDGCWDGEVKDAFSNLLCGGSVEDVLHVLMALLSDKIGLSYEKGFGCDDFLNDDKIFDVVGYVCASRGGSSLGDINFYRWNFYSFCIILEIMAASLRLNFDKNRVGSVLFFNNMYWDIKKMAELYVKFCAAKRFKYDNEQVASLNFSIFSCSRNSVDMSMCIDKLLYFNTVKDNNTADFVNISVFAIRSYVESIVRRCFNVNFDVHDKIVPMSRYFDVLDKFKSDLVSDKKMIENIDKHIVSLRKINAWSNRYVHSDERVLYWEPCYVNLYLGRLMSDCKNSHAINNSEISLFPELICKESSVYNLIVSELRKERL